MEMKKQFYKTMLYVLSILMILVIAFSAVATIVGINDVKKKRAAQSEPRPYEIEEYSENISAGSYTKVEIEKLDIQVTVTEQKQGSVNKKEVGAYYDFETTDGKKGVIYISEELKQDVKEVYDLISYYKYTVNTPNYQFADVPKPVTMYGKTISKPKGELINGKYSSGVVGVGEAYIKGSIEPEMKYPTAIPDYDDIVNKIMPILIICLFLLGAPFVVIFKKYKAM